jgi:hypothetical protein
VARAPEAASFFSGQHNLGSGGAIYNAGILSVQKCVFTNNASGNGSFNEGNGGGNSADDGGAIYNSGNASILNCSFVGNFCGDGVDGAVGGNGGAIKNDGTCTLNLCSITGNQTGSGGSPAGNLVASGGDSGNGGGVYNMGTMVLMKCVVNSNYCGHGADGGNPGGSAGNSLGGRGGWGGGGGGIYNSSKMLVEYSSIFGNVSGNAGNGGAAGFGGVAGVGGLGGGIRNLGELTMNASTVSTNLCGPGGNGGAGSLIAEFGGSGGSGGGIENEGSLNLTSCTIVLNSAGTGGDGGAGGIGLFQLDNPSDGGEAGEGGGIYNFETNSAILRNTLVGLNGLGVGGKAGEDTFIPIGSSDPTNTFGLPGLEGFGPDVSGDFISGGYNLVSAIDGSTGFINTNQDIFGLAALRIDPLIGPLLLNGGPTPTHALLEGSPAIDRGNNFKIRKDQRGEKRPFDFEPSRTRPGEMAATSARLSCVPIR